MSIPSGKKLIIVWHSRTGAASQMARAAYTGACEALAALQADDSAEVSILAARDTQAQDLLQADAYLFCAPENLGALSGEMKDCLDRCYYDVLDACNGKPYAVIIAAGTDGEGAARQLERICTGWRLRSVAPPLIIRNGAQTRAAILAPKTVAPNDLTRCKETGGTLAALLVL
ncbi:NAD(P)H-dependent oxidoreductase [Pusillimonas sp. CC-YST705]|uniref:NAD(P)H-dependent oxidoreductase n=1 Tax=Mesopusillimonas faecipullorum TaxID=2755040 RepID=A0ABS8C8V2_9BURK|nr:NAD(P)H-dependent oxidoreductase [Mesopusillimonas faecipullorum]MCB5362455.1 NAD(P)H-dependent oxidoreductase [Mesopusillimonas faecipullorum]